jgi:hypothetical protein
MRPESLSLLPVVVSGQLIVVTPFATSTCNGGTRGDAGAACAVGLAADFSIDRSACGSAEEMAVVTASLR